MTIGQTGYHLYVVILQSCRHGQYTRYTMHCGYVDLNIGKSKMDSLVPVELKQAVQSFVLENQSWLNERTAIAAIALVIAICYVRRLLVCTYCAFFVCNLHIYVLVISFAEPCPCCDN